MDRLRYALRLAARAIGWVSLIAGAEATGRNPWQALALAALAFVAFMESRRDD